LEREKGKWLDYFLGGRSALADKTWIALRFRTVGVWKAGSQRNAAGGTLGALRRRTPEPEV
jgi:hypothetical protein